MPRLFGVSTTNTPYYTCVTVSGESAILRRFTRWTIDGANVKSLATKKALDDRLNPGPFLERRNHKFGVASYERLPGL